MIKRGCHQLHLVITWIDHCCYNFHYSLFTEDDLVEMINTICCLLAKVSQLLIGSSFVWSQFVTKKGNKMKKKFLWWEDWFSETKIWHLQNQSNCVQCGCVTYTYSWFCVKAVPDLQLFFGFNLWITRPHSQRQNLSFWNTKALTECHAPYKYSHTIHIDTYNKEDCWVDVSYMKQVQKKKRLMVVKMFSTGPL